ncbi:MAG: adenosylmethionine decarboxylase [Candidatus Omnitrophota bacterium]
MESTEEKEYCCTNGYIRYAGTHLIIELWKGENFDSLFKIEQIFKDAINACGATLLNIDLHKFNPSGGISGVAIIKESHISIHTWPEYSYAALDIFVCGDVNPYKAIPIIKEGFRPEKINVTELKRGIF